MIVSENYHKKRKSERRTSHETEETNCIFEQKWKRNLILKDQDLSLEPKTCSLTGKG